MNRATLQELLRTLSRAFHTRDAEALMELFSATENVTYAGSESGEMATGPHEVRRLLSDLLSRPTAYSFEFRDLTFGEHRGTVWLVADGDGTQTGDDGTTEAFPYRVTGVLAHEDAHWRWLMLTGSEPTPAS
ncbi:MAG: nuclear transport factor 2 family protein [Actinomycetota bacterium]|nr:nuclear transport factor 2 family protein [Actinomycetota bacterium]